MSQMFRASDLGSGRDVEEGRGDPFVQAFRATRMPMLITDPRQPDNPIIFVNDAFSDLTGYAREEVVGNNCRFLQGPETDRETVSRMREAIAQAQPIEVEILNYRKDGSTFWNALVISPVHGESGELSYFFASQFDISDKKRIELALTETKAHLEEEVERRMGDLRSALDQKTVLLHEVDHRVKNNLQVVTSLVLLKARRMRDPAVQRALHNMAERIAALSTVHRLLYNAGDVSRFDLAEFIADFSADLLSTVEPGRIALDLDVEPLGVPAAKAAPLALLLNELMGNVIKHAFPEDRQGRLLVSAHRGDGSLRVTVADDGIGLGGSQPTEESFGRTLIDMLVRQLKGEILWEDLQPGTRATIAMPLNAEEAQL